jgi:hypothetical protein
MEEFLFRKKADREEVSKVLENMVIGITKDLQEQLFASRTYVPLASFELIDFNIAYFKLLIFVRDINLDLLA